MPDAFPTSPGVLAFDTTHEASLHDVQLSLVHRRVGQPWRLLWGLRYSQHEDAFGVNFTGQTASPPAARPPLQLRGTVVNRMIGLEVGTDRRWDCGPLECFGRVKGERPPDRPT